MEAVMIYGGRHSRLRGYAEGRAGLLSAGRRPRNKKNYLIMCPIKKEEKVVFGTS